MFVDEDNHINFTPNIIDEEIEARIDTSAPNKDDPSAPRSLGVFMCFRLLVTVEFCSDNPNLQESMSVIYILFQTILIQYFATNKCHIHIFDAQYDEL
jgi:hypothetical protein